MNVHYRKIILFIHSEQPQSALLCKALEEAGYQVCEASQSENLKQSLRQVHPHLVLLDWNLPGGRAMEVTRAIRSDRVFARMPIILTGREISAENRILSLETGVDFCVDGNSCPKELVARMRALLRRA
jgi:two-component system, OmpR family, phosphate regulon response regulator PhoB